MGKHYCLCFATCAVLSLDFICRVKCVPKHHSRPKEPKRNNTIMLKISLRNNTKMLIKPHMSDLAPYATLLGTMVYVHAFFSVIVYSFIVKKYTTEHLHS